MLTAVVRACDDVLPRPPGLPPESASPLCGSRASRAFARIHEFSGAPPLLFRCQSCLSKFVPGPLNWREIPMGDALALEVLGE